MCENWCVSNEAKYFNIKVYDGEKMVKSKKQCKTLELDPTTFLNVHGVPNDYPKNEFCYSTDEDIFGED